LARDQDRKRRRGQIGTFGPYGVKGVEVNGYQTGPGEYPYRANLTHAVLVGANLSEVILDEADARGADLSAAKLKRVLLSRADLSGAYLTGAYLDVATADEMTIWPECFNPKTAGVIFD
jgi:hypothetical protein